MPAFSVVMPLHNKQPHVARALRSILTQSIADIEVLVVDDASTDRSMDEVATLADPRIRTLRREVPGPGGYAARNLGIEEARCEWVAFLDADDEWAPDHLARYVALIHDRPESAVLGSGWHMHNPAGLHATWYVDPYYERNRERGVHVLGFDDYLRAEIAGRRPIWTSVACIRRSVLQAVGGFPAGRTNRGGDVDTWLRCIAYAGGMSWSPHIGATYHRDAVNMVTRTEPFTAACERATVRLLLTDAAPHTTALLKRFSNRRSIGAWKQNASVSGPRFSLLGKLYLGADPGRAAFWSMMSVFPPSAYVTLSSATKALKRARRRTVGWLARQPAAEVVREVRTAGLRLLTRNEGGKRQSDVVYLGDGARATFFGYHDKTPFSEDGRRILAMSVAGENSNAPLSEPLALGYFAVDGAGAHAGDFTAFAETRAWCWQQGCMLQWHPLAPARQVIFNSCCGDTYGSVVFDVDDVRTVREYDVPVYAIDPLGRYAASLNFARLGRLRPGYGYDVIADASAGTSAPHDDGLFLLDLDSGSRDLAVSLAELAAGVEGGGGEHYVNHATFSPDGRRILFLHLWGEPDRRRGRMCLYDVSDGHMRVVEGDRTVSHYCWRNENEFLATTRAADGVMRYTLYDLAADRRTDLSLPLARDGHPMFRPTEPWSIVTDTYPDRRRDQSLYLADIATGHVERLGRFYSPHRYRGSARCDLHPRWDRTGSRILLDTTARGHREVALVTPLRDGDEQRDE